VRRLAPGGEQVDRRGDQRHYRDIARGFEAVGHTRNTSRSLLHGALSLVAPRPFISLLDGPVALACSRFAYMALVTVQLLATGFQRHGEQLRPGQPLGLGAAGDGDLCGLLDLEAVLGDEFGWHLQPALDLAEVAAVRGQCRELPLRQCQFEGVEGGVRDRLERRRGDTGFADERRSHEVDRDAVALQHHDQAGERFPAVGDEDRGALQRHGQQGGYDLGIAAAASVDAPAAEDHDQRAHDPADEHEPQQLADARLGP